MPGAVLRCILCCCIFAACSSMSAQVRGTGADTNLGLHLDETGRYRYRQTFSSAGDAEEIIGRATVWARHHHGNVGESVAVESSHTIGARGSFRDNTSAVSDYVYYDLNITARDGEYTVTYESFAYQAAPTHHVVEFELKLPRREAVHAKTEAYIRKALADLRAAMPASTSSIELFVDRRRFALAASDSGFILLEGDASLTVPVQWLVPIEDNDEQAIVSPDRFSETVIAFPVGDGLVGLHLSSYAIQSEGSAQAAAGRDAFLLLDERDRSLSDGQMMLGVSKLRVRSMGCWTALMHRFLVGDVDGNGLTDLGVLREEVNCLGTDYDVETPRGYPLKWHVFTGLDWEYRPEFDDELPRGALALPLIDLETTPVEFVRQVTDGI